MKNVAINFSEVILLTTLIYLSIKYWKSKLLYPFCKGENIYSYSVFVLFQIITLSLIFFSSFDSQTFAFVTDIDLFGNKSKENWAFLGVQVVGSSLTYIIANVFGHLIYKIAGVSKKGLYNSISLDEKQNVLLASILILVFGYAISLFVLRPFLLNWIADSIAYLPFS